MLLLLPPYAKTASSVPALARVKGKSERKNFSPKFPRNRLISLVSHERIQGNPRKSNARKRGFSQSNAPGQENPNGSMSRVRSQDEAKPANKYKIL
jgi:hypothetical protein